MRLRFKSARNVCAVYVNANLKSCMVCYMILSDEQSEVLFTSESSPSSSLASHRTKGIYMT